MSIGFARLASRGRSGVERRAGLLARRRQLEPDRLAGVGAEDAEPAAVRQHGDARAARKRLAGEEDGDVGEILERVGLDHAGLAEDGLDRGHRARERGRVRARRPLAGARAAALHRQDRLLARDPLREPPELARVPERLQVEEDQVGLGVVLPVLEQVVGGDVRLVPDRDERREAEPARRRLLEQGEPERPALRREADVARPGRCAVRRSRSARRRRRRCRGSWGRSAARRGRGRGRAAAPGGARPRRRSRRSRPRSRRAPSCPARAPARPRRGSTRPGGRRPPGRPPRGRRRSTGTPSPRRSREPSG